MNNEKIRIKLHCFDHRSLERATGEIVGAIKRIGAKVSVPIPLPRDIQRFTVLRSPHVYKKSREQFEIRTHKRLITITYPTPQIVDALTKIDLPDGVDVKIQLVRG